MTTTGNRHLKRTSVRASWLHLLGCLNLFYTVWQTYQPTPMVHAMTLVYGGRSNFLTIWGLFFATLTFALNILLDLAPTSTLLSDLRTLSMAIALPLESVVSTIYWAITLTKPELMILPELGVTPSLAFDLALHLWPTVLLWLDQLLGPHSLTVPRAAHVRLSAGRRVAPTTLVATLTAAYSSWIEFTSASHGKNLFPYPFLSLASFPARLVIYLGAAGAAWFYLRSALSLSHHLSAWVL